MFSEIKKQLRTMFYSDYMLDDFSKNRMPFRPKMKKALSCLDFKEYVGFSTGKIYL
jgi:hypothetical protein